ncbi:MAG: cold shock domain-containing protein [Chloroflexi bacterium]|nr:cold shock domain-containing protein [Chloroflexota bacterium]
MVSTPHAWNCDIISAAKPIWRGRRRCHTAKGTIRRLVADRGFGFIKPEVGQDLFFHRSQLEGVDFGSLREEQEVEFEVGKDPNDRPRALRVRLAPPKGE